MITLDGLRGCWHLQRHIDDRRLGLVGQMDGTACWTPHDGGLLQLEEGVLRFGDAPPMQATRRYLWRDHGGVMLVSFADGRPFHAVSADLPEATHFCDPDTYEVSYDMSVWPVWQTRWHVTGPRKHAVIISRFSPIPDHSDAAPIGSSV
jgi:hypothetical protein